MKCDKLKAYKADVTIPVYGTIADAEVHLKADVDAVIAELKAENKRLNGLLNVWNTYKILADTNKKLRATRRALYKACANWALSTLAWLDCIDQGEPRKWSEMRQKCLKKAEEYK